MLRKPSDMLFNSLAFLIFFPAVVVIYWLLTPRWRNKFLLIASYYFYMNWEPVFALLILFTSVTTWLLALKIIPGDNDTSKRKNRLAVTICLILNFGILFIFKYADFFGSIVNSIFSTLHIGMEVPALGLLLPVGISFYTFQAIGYIIDVYRGTISAERNFIRYALFVSFFPQLVAGPIERAKNLLPQFRITHHFSSPDIIYGFRLMLTGYFMKLCVADNLSPYVDAVYSNLNHHSGLSILLATFFFTFQILCDFGGYSLIAIGSARCMGFKLMQNFRQPYYATSIRDFWHRWHISLSTWFTDYLYIPLGGNRVSRAKHYRNLFLTFVVSGLWHGANSTFLVWGAYHGLLISGQAALRPKRDKAGKAEAQKPKSIFQYVKIAGAMLMTFILVMIGWVFFRANTMSDAMTALSRMARPSGPFYTGAGVPAIILSVLMIGLLLIFEVYNERKKTIGLTQEYNGIMTRRRMISSIAASVLLIIVILLCGQFDGGQFIYFQF